MSPGGNDNRCIGLTVLPPSGADCLEILGTSTSWSVLQLGRGVQNWFRMASSYMMAFRLYLMMTLQTRSANIVTNVLRRWGRQVLQHLHYHPDLSPYSYHLITKPKSTLHGKRFANFNSISAHAGTDLWVDGVRRQ